MLPRLYVFTLSLLTFFGFQKAIAQTNPTQLYDLMGMVYIDSMPSHSYSQYTCEAELYQFIDSLGEYSFSSSSVINYNTGQYSFSDIKPGKYLVKTSTSNSLEYFPTYYPDHAVWSEAQEVTIVNNSVFTANVFMSPVTYVGYDGASISGNIYNQVDSSGESSIVVYLMDTSRNPLLYSVSDSLGNYAFNNLDFGAYLVHAEVMNKVSDELEVVLSPQNAFPSINFNIGLESVTPTVSNISNEFNGELRLFPNPFKNDINIDLNSLLGSKIEIAVLDIMGRTVYTSINDISNNSFKDNITLDNLSDGVYTILISIDDAPLTMKRVVKIK